MEKHKLRLPGPIGANINKKQIPLVHLFPSIILDRLSKTCSSNRIIEGNIQRLFSAILPPKVPSNLKLLEILGHQWDA